MSNLYKICVYAICKNEANFVDRWYNSVKNADYIVVCDTGSDDDTYEKLLSHNILAHKIEVFPWRFDTARNISLNFIPEDTDICVCLDLDEILDDDWRSKIENTWHNNTTRMRYTFNWSIAPDGSPQKSYFAEKIHSRNNFKWIYPVHEVLEYTGENPDIYVEDFSLCINHYPDTTKSRSQYLELLELSAMEFPEYDRNIHYLGREYMYNNMYSKAISTLEKHLQLKTATWIDERCASKRYIARCYKEMKNYYKATEWLYSAIAEAPYLREPYMDMALLGFEEENWPKTYHMINEALKINFCNNNYLTEPCYWNFLPYDLGAISAYNLGLYEKAIELAKLALDKSPDDIRLQSNYDFFNEIYST